MPAGATPLEPSGTQPGTPSPIPAPPDRRDRRRCVVAGLLLGAALMAAVDEIVFHQVLGWHHFYDLGTRRAALLSDGLLHAAELVALVWSLGLLLDLSRRQVLARSLVTGANLTGAGAFQLLDGLVNHKVLGLHQVRYGVDLLPYDVAWVGTGAALLAAGLVVLGAARRRRTVGSRGRVAGAGGAEAAR